MSKTINNFLVGLGFKYDGAGVKKFDGALTGLRSKALQLGAILGAGLGTKDILFNVPKEAEELGIFADQVGVTANQVNTLGTSLKFVGGTAADAQSALQSLNKIRTGDVQSQAALRANLEQHLLPGKKIVDDIVNAKNSYDAYLKVRKDGAKLTYGEQIRLTGLLGLSQKIALQMRESPKSFNDMLSRISKLNPDMNRLAKEAVAWNDEWTISKEILSGVATSISSDIIPPLTKALHLMNKFAEKHRKTIGAGLGVAAAGLGAGAFFGLKAFGQSAKADEGLLKATVKGVEASIKGTVKPIEFGAKAGLGMIDSILTPIALALTPRTMGGSTLSKADRTMMATLPVNKYANSPIQVNLSFDGHIFDKKIIDINNEQNTHALNDIFSEVRG